MDADAEARQVGDEDKPAVAVRLVRHVFPLQYQPEHDGSEQGGEGIHLALYGTEPECIAERIGQRTHQAATHDGDQLLVRDLVFVGDDELAYQVCDAPEEEQDAGAAHEGAHIVHHLGYRAGIGGEL